MKNIILVLTTLLLISACNNNESNQQNEFQTENATIYYDASGIDNCVYTIETDSKKTYTVENLNNDFNQNNLRVKISFEVTDNIMNCGFSGGLKEIKIVSIEKL